MHKDTSALDQSRVKITQAGINWFIKITVNAHKAEYFLQALGRVRKISLSDDAVLRITHPFQDLINVYIRIPMLLRIRIVIHTLKIRICLGKTLKCIKQI